MCGRFTFVVNPEEVMEQYQLSSLIDFPTRYNIAPTQEVLVVVNDGENNRAGTMSWGLVPSWAKDPAIGSKMINARVETADQKPSFKKLMERRRCLVLADSFYEWKKSETGKQPVRISVKNRNLFAFAGLWDRWHHEDGEKVTCTILTKDANPFMKTIHHRMPIILPKKYEQAWIEREVKNPTEMKEWVSQLPDEEFEYYAVSSYVNNARNESEECIKPLVN
ncbi:SOS response-associated peptidase [Bacillaceae bacterium W0354]